MSTLKNVCVFCASSTQVPQCYLDDASLLGQLLAAEGIAVTYGGGSVGLMGALAEAVLRQQGTLIGVIPKFMMELEWGNPNATRLIVTTDMAERKRKMIEHADAIVVLPGGTGTLEELAEVLSMKKLGLFRHPVVLVNTEGFFDLFVQWIKRMIKDNFLHPAHLEMVSVVNSPSEVIDAIKNALPWTDDHLKYAAL